MEEVKNGIIRIDSAAFIGNRDFIYIDRTICFGFVVLDKYYPFYRMSQRFRGKKKIKKEKNDPVRHRDGGSYDSIYRVTYGVQPGDGTYVNGLILA